MAKETISASFELQAPFETLQAIRCRLADEVAQATLISRLSETLSAYLPPQTTPGLELRVTLKVSAPVTPRRGPRSVLPKVQDGLLTWFDEYEQRTNIVGPVGSEAYLTWLDQDYNRSFRYETETGAFTAIKETRRGRPVWYAHRRRQGQLRRVYLGLSQNLTPAKLAQAAQKLNSP